MLTDPIADMLTRIRNAARAGHPSVDMPSSEMKVAIAKVLKEEGFVKGYHVSGEAPQKTLTVELKYPEKGRSVLTGIQRVSRPGLRTHVGTAKIPLVQEGLGIAILSTSKGIMTGHKARRLRVGGEVLCHVW